MTFSQELRQEYDDIFQAIFHHPFVQGIGKGELAPEQLIHYVKQDFEYLNSFIRVYGIALSKSQTRDEMDLFNEQVTFILNSEIHPHNNFCEVAGTSYESIQYSELSPTALNYINHMLTVAHKGSMSDIYGVLLPCPWTYNEIGDYLLENFEIKEDHPFYDWIHFYATTDEETDIDGVTTQFRNRLDAVADSLSDQQKLTIKDAFKKSCQLEYKFWDMAYNLEEWEV